MAPVAPALASVTCLNLTRVGLSPSPVSQGFNWTMLIAEAMEQLCSLQHIQKLSLRGNKFGDTGAAALAQHIGRLSSLRVLDVTFCNINDSGGLAEALHAMPQLERLACAQFCGDEHLLKTLWALVRKHGTAALRLVDYCDLFEEFAFCADD